MIDRRRDVDILLRRDDLPRAIEALTAAGFVYRHSAGIDRFLDGPTAKARDAVHIVFAGEKVRQEYQQSAPDVEQSKSTGTFRVLDLDALLRMKLTSFRDKDRVHIRDLIEVGLVDERSLEGLPEELAARLRELLENPEG
jgi:hypothetical protein